MKTQVTPQEASVGQLVFKKERLVNLAKSSKTKSGDITTTSTLITTTSTPFTPNAYR